jgi:hypothetical protein
MCAHNTCPHLRARFLQLRLERRDLVGHSLGRSGLGHACLACAGARVCLRHVHGTHVTTRIHCASACVRACVRACAVPATHYCYALATHAHPGGSELDVARPVAQAGRLQRLRVCMHSE